MKAKSAIIAGVSVFFLLCAVLIVHAAVRHPREARALAGRIISLAGQVESSNQTPAIEEAKEPVEALEVETVYPQLTAVSAKEQTVALGAVYDDIKRTDEPDKYKFRVELTSKGAAVKTATLSEFKDRTIESPAPLVLLAPLMGNRNAYSLANTSLKIAPMGADSFGIKAFPWISSTGN